MGETRKDALRLDFDRRLKPEFHGTKVTTDAGLLAYREPDEVLGLTSAIDSDMCDIRTGKNTQHGIAALLRRLVLPKSVKQWSFNFFGVLCQKTRWGGRNILDIVIKLQYYET